MSLLGSMTQGKKRNITINVEDVRTNPMNMYHFEDEVIDSLANSIKKYGQLENATVYEDTSKNDGCKYTLIGGESRYRAIISLVEKGEHEGNFNVTVVDKPNENDDELEMLLHDNIQRHKTKKTMIKEIELYEEIYKRMVEKGQRPAGEKREWIGNKVGISGRNVDRLKKEFLEQPSTDNSNNQIEREITNKDINNAIRRNVKALKKTVKMMENKGDIDVSLIEEFNDIINNLERVNLIND